jgi:hypothetical protein
MTSTSTDKSFWRQLLPFLLRNVAGEDKNLLGAGFAAFILPIFLAIALGYNSTFWVEVITYIGVFLGACIGICGLASEGTKAAFPEVIPALTVFAAASTVLVGVVVLMDKLNLF